MRVLAAGGAGFIGSHLCRALLSQGHEVICLDNLITGSRANVADLMGQPGFEFIQSDVCMPPRINADLVFHLASPASPVHYSRYSIETMLANSVGTYRLLSLARDCGAAFLFASTSEVYGDPLEHPQTESYWGNVNPIGPRACYDEAKRFGEALIFEHRRRYGVTASVVRIFNTYGPSMNMDDGRVVPAFISAALAGQPLPLHGEGTQTRSFCYVSDLIDGLIRIAIDPGADGEVFNLGNPHEVSILALAEVVARLTGRGCELLRKERPIEDPDRRRPDITKVKNRYGWEPRVSLEEGLRLTIEYFKTALKASGREDGAERQDHHDLG